MALKRNLNDAESEGLTDLEIREATKWLRKHKTRGIIPKEHSSQLFELFMLGYSTNEIHNRFPEWPFGQICLTIALRGWVKERAIASATIQDQIRSRVIRSVIEQVEFLTTMMSVANAEHFEQMKRYIADPKNNPPPKMKIESIKEYKEVSEALHKLVTSAANIQKEQDKPTMLDVMSSAKKKKGALLEEDSKLTKQNQINLDDDEFSILDVVEASTKAVKQ